MSYSFSQPELYSDYIIISSPRIFVRPYASTVLYSGQSILNVASPLTGWTDVGLISNVAIPVTRNMVKLQLGLPKTTRKVQELLREGQVTLTYHEMALATIAALIGVTEKNVISLAAIVSQANSVNAVSTLASANDANKFVVGDYVTFWDASGDALSTEELVISAVDPTAKTVTCVGTWTIPPEAADQLIAKAGTVASYSTSDPSVTLATGDGSRFAVGDRVIFIAKAGISADNLGGLRTSTDRRYITALTSTKLTLSAAFTGTPVATDIVAAYKSVEMLDPLGTIAEKSLLVFFDWVVNSVQRQLAIWYPKATVIGSFAPDFKAGENFMEANMSFEVQSTTQIMTDGTSQLVVAIPFMFD